MDVVFFFFFHSPFFSLIGFIFCKVFSTDYYFSSFLVTEFLLFIRQFIAGNKVRFLQII